MNFGKIENIFETLFPWLDLPENKIGEIQIKQNKFAKAASNFIEIDKDPNYSKDFIKKKVVISGNEFSQKCNCTPNVLPKDDEDSVDDNDLVRGMLMNSSRYVCMYNYRFNFWHIW